MYTVSLFGLSFLPYITVQYASRTVHMAPYRYDESVLLEKSFRPSFSGQQRLVAPSRRDPGECIRDVAPASRSHADSKGDRIRNRGRADDRLEGGLRGRADKNAPSPSGPQRTFVPHRVHHCVRGEAYPDLDRPRQDLLVTAIAHCGSRSWARFRARALCVAEERPCCLLKTREYRPFGGWRWWATRLYDCFGLISALQYGKNRI